MAMSTDAGEGEPLVEINVTPMVDVLLSLLIIFMVASPEPPNEQLPLNIPQSTPVQQPDDPNASLLLTIEDDGSARLGKAPLSSKYEEMVEQLQANEKAQADDKIVISAAPKVPYGRVIRVMAAAHEAGIAEVGVASDRL
jgi:biopolymer transport protein ExbD